MLSSDAMTLEMLFDDQVERIHHFDIAMNGLNSQGYQILSPLSTILNFYKNFNFLIQDTFCGNYQAKQRHINIYFQLGICLFPARLVLCSMLVNLVDYSFIQCNLNRFMRGSYVINFFSPYSNSSPESRSRNVNLWERMVCGLHSLIA